MYLITVHSTGEDNGAGNNENGRSLNSANFITTPLPERDYINKPGSLKREQESDKREAE